MALVRERKSLLSSQARIQAPWVKVTIGSFTFGVFDKKEKSKMKDLNGYYSPYDVQYPNYIQSLSITKINGQVNRYTLNITYPVRPMDDPNFFEKVFSSVSNTRKIVFSYGDSSTPAYCYKDEEAMITNVTSSFNLSNSSIIYVVEAISTAVKGQLGNFTFAHSSNELIVPSAEIKRVFKDRRYGLQSLFTGMNASNLDQLIEGGDKAVTLSTKTNISPLDYISYLVSCMIPAGSTKNDLSSAIYILTVHDETSYEDTSNLNIHGPYFRVKSTTYSSEQSDAYEVDIGYNTANIVTAFSIQNSENYSIYYDYTGKLYPETYKRTLNNKGEWEDVYAPTFVSKNDQHKAIPEDTTWYTKLTKYPIKASITILGLLRPASLMQYLRLNVIFPGGNKHIASGLYIVTGQRDEISANGYQTTLSLTKIGGDNTLKA